MEIGRTAIKIVKNTLIQSAGRFISAGLGFVTVFLLTRYLGASGYGNFTLVFSYLAFFSIISDFGMQLAIVKEISSFKGNSIALYGTYFWLKLSLVIISSTLALIVLIFFPYSIEIKSAILLGTLAVSLSSMSGYPNAIFQARIRLDLITIVDVLTKFITVIFIILFVFLKLNFYFIVSTVFIGNLFGLIFSLALLHESIYLNFDKSLVKKIAILSIPIGITSFISTLYFKVDVIILSIYKNSVDVGIYSLAYKILENILIFWGFYMASTFPIMAKLKFEDIGRYNSIFKKSIIIGVVCSIPMIIILFFASPLIINIFGGNDFYLAVNPFKILIFSLPIFFLNGIFYNHYIIERKNIVTSLSMIVALVANVWMNVVFIPKYSYIAASYATVISAAILLLGYVLGLRFHHKIREL